MKFRQRLTWANAVQSLRAIILYGVSYRVLQARAYVFFSCKLCESIQFALIAICTCRLLLPHLPPFRLWQFRWFTGSIPTDSARVTVPGGCHSYSARFSYLAKLYHPLSKLSTFLKLINCIWPTSWVTHKLKRILFLYSNIYFFWNITSASVTF